MSKKDQEKVEVHPLSVNEAKQRLDPVKSILKEMNSTFTKFENKNAELVKLSSNADPHNISKLRYEVDVIQESLEDMKIDLLSLDCVLKDYRSGLVDFIAIRNNTRVWLCYKYGEEDLKYYHGWNDGFVGRQIIDFE